MSAVDATNRFSEPKVYTSKVLFVNGKTIGSLLFVNKKTLKVHKQEIFDSLDFHYFYTIKPS